MKIGPRIRVADNWRNLGLGRSRYSESKISFSLVSFSRPGAFGGPRAGCPDRLEEIVSIRVYKAVVYAILYHWVLSNSSLSLKQIKSKA
jgi:hypothetical protein